MRKYVIIIMLTWLAFLSACHCFQEDNRLEQALQFAGTNRPELEKVLEHYEGDSLKYKAAKFLIMNMPYHFAAESWFVSPKGERYRPDMALFAGKKEVQRHCDSLLAAGYRIERRNSYDIRQIKADYLTDRIDQAFEVWAKPWAGEVSFDDFCRYILPYRSQNEPLTGLGRTLMERYLPLLDSAGVRTPIEACSLLNTLLKEKIKYVETGSPLAVTMEDMERSGKGTCEALCDYTVHAMRAVGIPVAVHLTVWTRMARGHVWPAVLSGGRFHDFSPGDLNPDTYPEVLYERDYLRPAKVYRKNYEATTDVPACDDGYVTFLKNPLIEDVTDGQPVPVYTLRIPLEPSLPEASPAKGEDCLLYLCAFNNWRWTPVASGVPDGEGNAVFHNVAGRNFFMVARAEGKDRLRMVSAPVCTCGDGSFRALPARPDSAVCHTFRKQADTDFQLEYWDCTEHRFRALSPQARTDTTLFYSNVPADALLFFHPAVGTMHDRVGVIDTDGVYKQSYSW